MPGTGVGASIGTILLAFLALFVATGGDYHIPAATVFRAKDFDEQGNLTYSFIVNTEMYDREVLFITGEGNRRNGPRYQRDQMRYYPRARLVVIPDAERSMFNENPRYTFQVIRKYMKQKKRLEKHSSRYILK